MRIQHLCSNVMALFLLWCVPVLAQDINELAMKGDLGQLKAWVEKDPLGEFPPFFKTL